MANKFEEYGKKYGTIIAIAVAVLVWLLPTPDTMTLTQHKLLTIFSGAIVLWITLSVSIATSTMFIVPLLYLWVGNPDGAVNAAGTLIRQASFAISGFGSASLWLLVTGFIISTAMTESGIARRVALLMMRRFGKTPLGAVLTPMFANLIIAPLTPSNTARTAAMLPIVEGVAQAYKIEKGKSNFGKALFLANTFASNITAGGFQTATIPNPIAIGLIAAAVGTASVGTTWSFWTLAALPTTILMLIGIPLLLFMFFKPEMKTIPGGLK
jgi:anion transporter